VEATVEVRDIAAARGTPTARPGWSIDLVGLPAGWTNTNPNDNEYKLYKAMIAKFGLSLPVDASAASGYQGMLGFVRAVNAGGGTDVTSAGILKAFQAMPATPYPLGGGGKFRCGGTAMVGISKNICSTVGFIADGAADGSLDMTGIFKLG